MVVSTGVKIQRTGKLYVGSRIGAGYRRTAVSPQSRRSGLNHRTNLPSADLDHRRSVERPFALVSLLDEWPQGSHKAAPIGMSGR
jgi:hypothetical protein